MSVQRPNHTLQTTALVNEVYLRLADQTNPAWQNRAHFFAVAARAMRQILVSYARSQRSQKRGGGAVKIELDEAAIISPEHAPTCGDLRFNPCWDDLRGDKRFDKIVAAAKAASK